MDDCLASVDTVDEATKLVGELKHLLSLGGFRLHKWNSNSEEVMKHISVGERSSNLIHLDTRDVGLQKTLGLCWFTQSDCFRFLVNLPQRPATKRGILSCVASLYDPLGFVAPLLLLPKRLLQDLCKRKCS